MAEWLGRGLQSPVLRFESGRRLQDRVSAASVFSRGPGEKVRTPETGLSSKRVLLWYSATEKFRLSDTQMRGAVSPVLVGGELGDQRALELVAVGPATVSDASPDGPGEKMARGFDDREGVPPSPTEPRLGRTLQSSATGHCRGQTLAELPRLRQAASPRDDTARNSELSRCEVQRSARCSLTRTQMSSQVGRGSAPKYSSGMVVS